MADQAMLSPAIRKDAATKRATLSAIQAASFAVPFLLAGCSRGAQPDANTRMIACGPVADAPTQQCGLNVVDKGGDLTLTLRRPDGGFRRLSWPKGGTLAPTDGAEPLDTKPLKGGGVEANIAGWRYRIERSGGGLP